MDTKMFTTLTFSEAESGVGLVTMNRPERLNAINPAMVQDFETLFAALAQDETIRVLILTGAGRGFCSGADLSDATAVRETEVFADPESYLRLGQERYGRLVLGLRAIPQPVIAAVNGPAAGAGFCLALASDIRFASPGAYFIASFINIGLSAGELGSSYLLPRLVGLSHASEILYTGRKVPAEEAERIGLISRTVPTEALIETALACARQMIAKSPGGLRLTKRALDRNIDAQSLQEAVDFENRNQALMVFSGEFFKLIHAFTKQPEKQ
ncbi:MAG: enoyl-CoA hydratase/isomerase family protein [Proteobacteria bacterium]|nr:enoyl-CoA hydratase/isomerase family protein [Pseudomonadota bacterium]